MSNMMNKIKEAVGMDHSHHHSHEHSADSHAQTQPHTESHVQNQPRTENQALQQSEGSYENQSSYNNANTGSHTTTSNNNTTSSAEGTTFKNPFPSEQNDSSSRLHPSQNQVLRGVDPLVTSDDNSRRTSATSRSSLSDRNPRDASQVPPSVFKQEVGAPTIEHAYPQDSTHQRHSVSMQEEHLIR
ncbi:hypothetical protein B0I35DRAFT_480269 [Stachybotrys elegans]|uniref:Uncharacterized protein n=1 Tax=Stachybotrys elegans TaxID=80388 RepID=A0A8K0WPA4_9HYPO|nr:hypothetical protein B0I35DRAFT_480269 [Stachybotrys elegans]